MPSLIRHLYVHIPFCHRICPYCSFYKHQPGGTDIPGFMQALLRETRELREAWGSRLDLATIYWGGGTPSLLSSEVLRAFLPEWLRLLGNPTPVEWTVEMNPKTLTTEKLALFREAGVTRASLGIQSWDPPVLATLGRDHSPDEAVRSYELLREAAFPVVSLDHMFSVPGQSLASWEATLQKSIGLKPDHISAYNLTYEEDTAFFESLQSGQFSKDIDTDADHFGHGMRLLTEAGYEHYETSNYAQPGFQSLHNSRYWSGADYLGLGPSAVSTVDRQRWKNIPDTARYTLLAGKPTALRQEEECLTDEQWRCERIALELRNARGVALEHIDQEKLPPLLEEGLLEIREERLCTTPRGKYVVDSLAEYLV
jgi:oxygen-independent coproporphyrinogen III oxidase